MAKDPYRYFRIEAGELLGQLAKGALDLEKGSAGAELVMRLLRLAHTLKGAARVVKQAEIADLAHRVEETLAPYRVESRDGEQSVPRERVDSVLGALDAITEKLAQLPLPESAEAVAVVPDASVRMVRADVAEMDMLLEGLGEIGSELAGVRRAVASVERIRDLAAQFLEQLALPHQKGLSIAEELHGLVVAAERNMAAGVERIERELRQALDVAERLRLVPAASVFNTLERTARDAAHSTGKQVIFEATGGDLRIDGEVLDTVQSALIQLVRNAVAHGIETETERKAAGKPAAGRVTLEVVRRGYRAWFRCTDDGRGVDLEAVRRAVYRRGSGNGHGENVTPMHDSAMAALIPNPSPANGRGERSESLRDFHVNADMQRLDAAQLLAMLLKGGITTTSVVTELAGRGIGLDVVREAMQRLNGEVVAHTAPGTGTTIELRVPLSLASLKVLIVEAGGHVAALPLDAVQRTLRAAPDDIVHSPEGDAIVYESKLIPFVPLTLGAPQKSSRALSSQAPRSVTAVIVAVAGTMTAVAVERLHGMDTVVLRPLPALAPADPIVLGMHLDSEGNPRIVLDPEELATKRQARVAQSGTQGSAQQAMHPILIIDDSLTTRMLESSILESAGFSVELAASGEEGLDMARRNSYALFLVDVEMPGMDGFSFVERTRADPVLREVPSILVTSRESQQDRCRGAATGAGAYIVKSEFDQVEFLERVNELVQRELVQQ